MVRARRRWIQEQGRFDLARLVFIDQTTTSTAMVRLRGRSPRGNRLIRHAPHGHQTITFVAGCATAPCRTLRAGWTNERNIFLAYLKRCLVPTLKHGDIVMMDSLPVHKVAGVQEAIEAAVRYYFISPTIRRISIRSNRRSASSSASAKVCRATIPRSAPIGALMPSVQECANFLTCRLRFKHDRNPL